MRGRLRVSRGHRALPDTVAEPVRDPDVADAGGRGRVTQVLLLVAVAGHGVPRAARVARTSLGPVVRTARGAADEPSPLGVDAREAKPPVATPRGVEAAVRAGERARAGRRRRRLVGRPAPHHRHRRESNGSTWSRPNRFTPQRTIASMVAVVSRWPGSPSATAALTNVESS